MPPEMPRNNTTQTEVSTPEQASTAKSHISLWVGGPVVLLVLVGLVYWFMPSIGQDFSPTEPRKIGIANFVQGSSSVTGLKKGLADLGYTDVQFVGKEVVPNPNMVEEIKAIYRKAIEEDRVDLLFADHEHQAL